MLCGHIIFCCHIRCIGNEHNIDATCVLSKGNLHFIATTERNIHFKINYLLFKSKVIKCKQDSVRCRYTSMYMYIYVI